MPEDVRKEPLVSAIRAIVEDQIEHGSLRTLVAFGDMLADAMADHPARDPKAWNRLFEEVWTASAIVRQEEDQHRRLRTAGGRRDDETEGEWQARLERWGYESE